MIKKYIHLATASLLLSSGLVWAEEADIESRLAVAEARLANLERVQQDSGGIADRLTINGFVSWSAARTNTIRNEAGERLEFDGWNTVLDHGPATRAGIQFDAQVNEQTGVFLQLLSRGSDDFDVEAQWAYLSYDFTPDITGRAGRMVLPFYMHSQYSRVGYAYPWVQLPMEVYRMVDMDAHEGIDLTWRTHTGPVGHDLNVYLSSMNVESEAVPEPYIVRDMHGVNLRSRYGDWSTWLGYTNARVSLDLSDMVGSLGGDFSLDRDSAIFLSSGIQYDNGRVLLMAERNQLSIDNEGDWCPELNGMYVMAGYRIGRAMPHLTWGRIGHGGLSEADEFAPGAGVLYRSIASRHESWTLGMRYDLLPGVALKLEASVYDDYGSERKQLPGFFSNPDPANPMDPTNAIPASDDPMVFRFAVDAVF